MEAIGTALSVITLVADVVAVFSTIRKAVLRCIAAYKRIRWSSATAPVRSALAA